MVSIFGPQTQAKPTLTDQFNELNAMEVYKNANTLQSGFLGIGVNKDATIKASSVQTNLEAMYAGYKGTSLEGQVQSFKNIILQYPELKEGMQAMMTDEGSNITKGFEKLLTGNGAIDMKQFETMMQDPTKRKLVGDMFQKVGTSKWDMEYAVEFTQTAMDAAQNPTDEKRKKFLDVARKANIETAALEQEEGMKVLTDFFKDPQKSIAGLIDKLDLSPEMKNGLTSILSSVVGFYKEAIGHYAYGEAGQPGLIQIAGNVMDNANIDGARIRNQYGMVTSSDTSIVTATPVVSHPRLGGPV